jgi:hypothetical protein
MTRKLIRNVAAAVALTLGVAAPATACDYVWKSVVEYKTVVQYETRTVPYTQLVTLYDHCGKPYQAEETFYKEIQVPVETVVPVKKLVKVYY